MEFVDSFFEGAKYATAVFISDKARKALIKLAKKNRQAAGHVLKRLEFYAGAGLRLYEGDKKPIRHEWDGVYRIGEPSSLFRLLGFYDAEDKTSFVIMDAYQKHGQSLSSGDRGRIDEVAKVRKNQLWRKRSRGSP